VIQSQEHRCICATALFVVTLSEGFIVKLGEIVSIVEGKPVSKKANLDIEITSVCAADLMSDVLAFAESGSVLLTGLCNPQMMHAAEMANIAAVIFVRGKYPPPETIALAEEKGIPLLASKYTMFEVCGRLYQTSLEELDSSRRITRGES